MNWETFIISILGSGIITALVNGSMNHKTQIKMIRESGLYAKRARALDELMKRMEELDQTMGSMISFLQTETEKNDEIRRREIVYDAFNSFVKFYRINRHYLSSGLSYELGRLCTEYKELFLDFVYGARPIDSAQDTKKWKDIVDKYNKDFPEKREQIAEEFRKIIGVK